MEGEQERGREGERARETGRERGGEIEREGEREKWREGRREGEVGERGRERMRALFFSNKCTNPNLTTTHHDLFKPNYLPKVPPPHTLKIRTSTYEF